MKTYVGIDNGASGSIGIITADNKVSQIRIPAYKALNFQKKKQYITRIDHERLAEELSNAVEDDVMVLIERPFTGQNIKTVAAGMRAFEAVLIVLEQLGMPYEVIDSKAWQKELLPSGIKGSAALKSAGKDVAKRLFPSLEFTGDADGILIAEYARRKQL